METNPMTRSREPYRTVLLLGVTVLLFLAACAPPGPGTTPGGGGSPGAGGDPTGQAEQADDQGGGGGGTLDFLWFTDGPDLAVMQKLVKQFEEEEGIDVNFLNIPYSQLEQVLQAQLTGGDPPDVARLTDLGVFRRDLLDLSPYLEDAEGFSEQFLDEPMAYASGSDGEVLGLPHDFTMNGPFVNLDMFNAAGIDVPGVGDEPWTWDELIKNAKAAQEAGGAPYAIAYDRSGHRFGGMLSQYGGRYFTEEGDVAFDSEGAQQAVSTFVELHEQGAMPLEVWVGAGDKYADAADFFVSQQAPVYFAGNWLVGHFADTIKDFEWAAMPNPCVENCGGFPGGKFVAAFKKSDQPELAAKLIEFLGSRDVMEEYVAQSLFLPTRKDLIESGLEYPKRNDDMNVFLAEIPKLPQATYQANYHPGFGPVADLAANQITAVLAGEADVPTAMETVQTEGQQLLEEIGVQ